MANFENEETNKGEPIAFKPIQWKAREDVKDDYAKGDMDAKLVDEFSKKFTEWEQARQPLDSIWKECYRLFTSGQGIKKLATRANVVVPVAFQVIEAAIPKLVNVIFGQIPFFDIEADKSVPTELVDKIRKCLLRQLEWARFFVKFVDFAKQLLIYGTSYFYVYWRVKRAWVYERTAVRKDLTAFGITIKKGALSWEKKLSYKVIERRPEVDVLDVNDVFPDPNGIDEESATGIFVRSEMDIDELKEMGKGKYAAYANTDKLDASAGTDVPQVIQDRRTIRSINSSATGTSRKGKVEILTYWGLYDLDGDGIREECQLVFANRKVLLKAIRNPFEHQEKPIIRSVLFPVPKEWYGIGLMEPIIPLCAELNTLRCQALDVNNLIINRMWKVNSLADIDLDTLITAPDGIVLTDNMDWVEPITQSPLPYDVHTITKTVQTDIENTTSPRSIQGSPSDGTLGRTARGAMMIIGQALEKFGLSAKYLEESAMRRILRIMHQLNMQFIDNDEMFTDLTEYGKIFGEKFAPETIRVDLTFRMLGISETMTKEAAMSQLTSFISLFKDVPGINLLKVARIFWDLMQLRTPSDVVIPAENPVEAAPFPEQIIRMMNGGGQASPVAAQVAANGVNAPAATPIPASMGAQ